jgi:hypothetical protein
MRIREAGGIRNSRIGGSFQLSAVIPVAHYYLREKHTWNARGRRAFQAHGDHVNLSGLGDPEPPLGQEGHVDTTLLVASNEGHHNASGSLVERGWNPFPG